MQIKYLLVLLATSFFVQTKLSKSYSPPSIYKNLFSPQDSTVKTFNRKTFTNEWKGRFALSAGFSWRTAKLEQGLNSFQSAYLKELKSGYAFDAEGNYFLGERYGLGARFNYFTSSYSVMATAQLSTNPPAFITDKLGDDITILFVGPKFCMRYPNRTKNSALLMGISLGYMSYNDDGYFGSVGANIHGGTFGIVWEMGYDLGLSQHFALGINLALAGGTLTAYDYTMNGSVQHVSLSKENYEGLGHVDITAGIRLR